jgi:hypothetical protein
VTTGLNCYVIVSKKGMITTGDELGAEASAG